MNPDYKKNRDKMLKRAKRRYNLIKQEKKDARGREFGVAAYTPSHGRHNGHRLL